MSDTRCHWLRLEDGSTLLIPGCWARVHDPEGQCTCGKWCEDTARQTIRSLQACVHRERRISQTLREALKRAGVPDPTLGQIMTTAQYTARQRRRAMHRAITEAGQ